LFVALQRRNKLDSAIANKEAFVAACDAGVMGTGGAGLFEAH
jgi:hypothetical protein